MKSQHWFQPWIVSEIITCSSYFLPISKILFTISLVIKVTYLHVLGKPPNTKLLFVSLSCHRRLTCTLHQDRGRKGCHWQEPAPLTMEPQGLERLALLITGFSALGCFFKILFLCFQPQLIGTISLMLSLHVSHGNYLLINPFNQVSKYLLSICCVPGIVLIVLNAGDIIVFKTESLPLWNF